MTAALVQKCNTCAKPFVKESGCNKMTCSCGNLQCYVCGESITDYKHFEVARKDGKKCPLYEKDDQRLDTKIKQAQADAVKKVLEKEEGLNEEDVKVDIPPVKPMNAQYPHQHLQQQLNYLQQQQRQQLHQGNQLYNQQLLGLYQQQHAQARPGLPQLPFFQNTPLPPFNYNIPAIPNVFPFQVNHFL